jgi:2-furoyl-CoA dehydrogenase 2Fe-2S iron sulfur subunit
MRELKAGERHRLTLTVNGRKVSGHAEPRMLLSDFLRQELGLTEIHLACEHGVCGACTVLLDGQPARSCLTFAVQAEGQRVETVQNLSGPQGQLNDLQAAFKKHHGLQCGYCTPGILISATAFLKTRPNPGEEEVREMLSGHLCRCTGYVGMVRAIMEVAEKRSEEFQTRNVQAG